MPFNIILFTVAFALVFILITRFFSRLLKAKTAKSIFQRFSIYAGVIVLSMLLVVLIPQEIKLERDPNLKIGYYPNLDVMIYADEWDENLAKDYIISQEVLTLDEDRLYIDSYFDMDLGYYAPMNVLVDRVRDGGDQIELILYETPTIFHEYNLTGSLGPFSASLKNNHLSIQAEPRMNNYAYFQSPFTVKLFQKDTLALFEEAFWRGDRIVHLKVPETVEIIPVDHEMVHIHERN